MITPQRGHGPSVALGWAGLTVIGAGLVDVALSAQHRAHTAHAGWATALLVLGLAQVGWGLASLAARRPLVPRLTAGLLLTAATGWTVVVAQGLAWPPTGSPAPMTAADAGAVVLQLVGAGTLGVLRRPRTTTARRASPRRSVAGWALGAALTTALVTPALASTEAGRHAVPHGTDSSTTTEPLDEPADQPGHGTGHGSGHEAPAAPAEPDDAPQEGGGHSGH